MVQTDTYDLFILFRKVAVHNKSKPQKEASSSDEEEEIDAKAKPNKKTKTTEDNSKG